MLKTQPITALALSAISAAGCLVGSYADAGTITIEVLTNDELQIVNTASTGGSVVSAVNFGSVSGGATDVDINGINHLVSSTSNGSVIDLITPPTIPSSIMSSNISFIGVFRGGGATQAGLSGDLQNLVGSIGGAPSLDLDVFGLTPGNDYLFQTYFEATSAGGALAALPQLGITFEGTDSQTFANVVDDRAYLITYAFTATDSTLDVQFDDIPNSNNVWLSGYSLQLVPEPSSLALLGLGGLLVARRRRG